MKGGASPSCVVRGRASQRPDQGDCRSGAIIFDRDAGALRGERGGLGRRHLQIVGRAVAIAIKRQALSPRRRLGGYALLAILTRQGIHARQGILHLPERIQHGLAVARGEFFIVRPADGQPRSPSATVEQIEDRGDRPERPETSIRADDRRLDRLIPRAEPEADARIEGGPRDADPRIGGDQAALRLGDVGTALKKFGGQGRRQVRQRKV